MITVGHLRSSVGLFLVSAVLVAAPAVSAATVLQTRSARPMSVLTLRPSLAGQILLGINTVRAEHSLRPLRLEQKLTASATDHSWEMAEHGFFGHESADGSSFSKRIARFYGWSGFSRWDVGENLFWASPDAAATETVQNWLRSPTHRRILLDPAWRDLGVAAIHDSSASGDYRGLEATIVTVDFGVRTR